MESAWAPAIAAALLSALLTALAVAYAHHRRLFDLPGRRRSHSQATPRGGGIGIVVAVLFVALLAWPESGAAWRVGAAIMLVGGVGWIDDHQGLAARWRLLAHVLAAAALMVPMAPVLGEHACALFAATPCDDPRPPGSALAVLLAVAVVWSINLHNFMDGIDGILAAQASFVFAVATLAFAHAGNAQAMVLALICLAATAGFLPFNFPHARIFMGDVGSGVLGLLIGLAGLGLSLAPQLAWSSGVIVMSGFVIDATCTLLSRMGQGRRWYSAHREHLYQWLVRSGFSHVRVVALYMGWNVLIVLPTMCWINRADASAREATMAALLLYACGIVLWFGGKRWCMRHAVAGGRHAAT